DFTLSSNTVSFSPSGPGGLSEGTFTIFVLDDSEIEEAESIVLTLKNPSNGAIIAATGEMVITIVDNDGLDPANYPLYEIQTVTTVDTNLEPDSIGQLCELRGIVYGVNLRPEGLELFLIDKNDNDDGIGVLNVNQNFGYTPQEGDEIAVLGIIDQLNGWTHIRADSVAWLSSDNPLFAPEFVDDDLDEASESKLIRINNLTVLSETPTGTSGINYTVTDGNREYTMRIDADTELFGMNLPNQFDAIGLGSQFDDSALPLDAGYQFLPRYPADILAAVSVQELEWSTQIRFFPNPTQGQLVIVSELDLDQVSIYNILGQELKRWTNLPRESSVELKDLETGTYFIHFQSKQGHWTSTLMKW
ncbi:MAG: T9SS type A sorting domain-containing protein, partial [Bacteroidota bacterium]